MIRKKTNDLLDMIKDGLLDKDKVILACVNYMSEDEVADMCQCEGFLYDDEDDEDDDNA